MKGILILLGAMWVAAWAASDATALLWAVLAFAVVVLFIAALFRYLHLTATGWRHPIVNDDPDPELTRLDRMDGLR